MASIKDVHVRRIGKHLFRYEGAGCAPVETVYQCFIGAGTIGRVAKAGREWVARDARGRLWSSYGETRGEAIQALLDLYNADRRFVEDA